MCCLASADRYPSLVLVRDLETQNLILNHAQKDGKQWLPATDKQRDTLL